MDVSYTLEVSDDSAQSNINACARDPFEPTSAALLCERCKSIFSSLQSLQSLVSEEGYEHHTLNGILQHANEGCPSCNELFITMHAEDFNQYEPLMLRAAVDDVPLSPDSGDKLSYPFSILNMNRLRSTIDDQIDVNICDPHNISDSGFPNIHPLVYDMGGELFAAQALRLLSVCLGSHDKCPRQSIPLLPTRVIDVGLLNNTPKLYVTSQGQRAQYTALSYCWGSQGQQSTATTASHVSMMDGITMSNLPQTIQDAIHITRNLNIPYLWVDAICIIQDNDLDRSREICRMGEIYKQSTLTIGGMSSESAYHGFIKTSVAKRGCLFPLLLPNGNLVEIELVISTFIMERPRQQLETRAWTFQEFFLSPRLLLFDHHEVRWQCQCKNLSPILGTSIAYLKYDSYRLPDNIFSDTTPADPQIYLEHGEYGASDVWKRIISDYSTRQVKFEDDRFYALAGIVNELKSVWQDDYLAGFWRKLLLQHLAWYRAPGLENTGHTEVAPFKAPTWSWLCTNHPVAIYGNSLDPLADVVECIVEPVDPMHLEGPFLSGKLTIMAKFLRMSDLPAEMEVGELQEILKATILDRKESQEWAMKMESEHKLYVSVDRDADKHVNEFVVIRLGMMDTGHGGYDAQVYFGLVLKEVTEELSQQLFRRVGRWEHFLKEENMRIKWASAQQREFCII
ncbi:heterokaryon incompatibility protein-domain-containing protein [Hyaloscypha sp. PMI_1271]|nr:heterokaryon incompatibility protein-domain-containing protein [Hyaloscypha sp. PMI_1271]